ncbi:MAG: alpha/beta hydrolase [Clostridia bacterium]|nr:alpha/beta hydrolase [Clostridia bacterium]
MWIKKRLMFWASVCLYVFTALYMLVTAAFFSVNENIYWLFLALALISLYDGILITSVREKLTDEGLSKKLKIQYIVYTAISVVCPISLVLTLISYFITTDKPEPVKKVKESKQKPEVKKPFYKQTNFIVMAVAFCMIFIAGFSGMMFETSAFSVKVSDFTLTKAMTEEYNTISVIDNDTLHYGVSVYKPKTATDDVPVATVFVMPGFTRTKATMAQYAIELSRRGFAVFTLDPNEQGQTGYVGFDEDGESMSYTTGANGLYYLIEYVYRNTEDFGFVDRDRIGLIGHSAGGGNVIQATEYFNYTHGARDFATSWIKSVYCSGYIKIASANRYKNLYANAALAYAYYDEGAFRYQGDNTALEVISLRFINEVNGAYNEYTSYEIDKDYGNMADGTYRIIHREKTNHCFEMYDGESISNTIAFFTDSLGVSTSIAPTSQTWFGKEFSNCISLVCGFMLVISLSGVLIANVKFFGLAKGKKIVNGEYVEENSTEACETALAVAADIVKNTVNEEVKQTSPAAETVAAAEPKKRTTYSKMMFWTTFIVTAIIACLDYVPLAYLSIKWLPDAANNVFTFLFPARMVNAVLFWATLNGLIGLIIFFGTILIENLVVYLKAKKKGEKAKLDWSKFKPLKIDLKGILITLLLSVILFGAFYLADQVSYWIFHQDFRFMLISASPLTWRFVVTWLEYLPLIFIFYVSNSIRVNCGIGFEGWSEKKVFIIGAIGNSVGLAFILLINYFCFFTTGSPFYGYYGGTATEVWLYINMVFALTPMMFILPIFNRLFYRQTNRVWLGPIVTSMIFVMMTLSASISFIPV